MDKPKVFIGSSTEGLQIAEVVHAYFNERIEATHWKGDIFLPGEFPLETLEEQLRHHSFAILVATPDDELIKRGESFQTMRDNILFEYGLFTGFLGRKRTFLLKPQEGEISIPSDVLGIIKPHTMKNFLRNRHLI
jgi:predicted nucleotide-binding protein